jgi:methyltransferase type 12
MNKIHEYYKNTKNALPHKNVQKVLEMHIIPGNAIDLGCGAGRDTICLIKNGWNVLAIDKEETKGLVEEKLNENELKNFRFSLQNFQNVELENNSLLVSNFSIPFCGKKYFKEFWNKIEESIEKGRIFCWELFSEQKIHG